ncbi:MAG: hypothetical protein ACTH58_16620 [Marinomonas foliarum]|uniref:hypothetical protein n=1 Tax=Marinomonas foliarum TaxID=491950 RepID=UPI003F96B246
MYRFGQRWISIVSRSRSTLLSYIAREPTYGEGATVEAAIALKFAASISPNRRDENKPVDNADLLRLVRSRPSLNETSLTALGDLVYRGGGKELVAIVNDIRSGKPVSL